MTVHAASVKLEKASDRIPSKVIWWVLGHNVPEENVKRYESHPF